MILPHVWEETARSLSLTECGLIDILSGGALQEIAVCRSQLAFKCRPRIGMPITLPPSSHHRHDYCSEACRPVTAIARAGAWEYIAVSAITLEVHAMTVLEYLETVERVAAQQCPCASPNIGGLLNLDMEAFDQDTPKLNRVSWVGNGVQFLNRYLSSALFGSTKFSVMLKFLQNIHCGGEQLMVDADVIRTEEDLKARLDAAERALAGCDPDLDSRTVLASALRGSGLLPGWGSTARRMRDMMDLALDLLQSPNDHTMSAFLARLPLVRRVAEP